MSVKSCEKIEKSQVALTIEVEAAEFEAAMEKVELHGKTGTLFCFDFQEDALQQVCGQRVKIESLDFEKVKALLFDGDS